MFALYYQIGGSLPSEQVFLFDSAQTILNPSDPKRINLLPTGTRKQPILGVGVVMFTSPHSTLQVIATLQDGEALATVREIVQRLEQLNNRSDGSLQRPAEAGANNDRTLVVQRQHWGWETTWEALAGSRCMAKALRIKSTGAPLDAPGLLEHLSALTDAPLLVSGKRNRRTTLTDVRNEADVAEARPRLSP